MKLTYDHDGSTYVCRENDTVSIVSIYSPTNSARYWVVRIEGLLIGPFPTLRECKRYVQLRLGGDK